MSTNPFASLARNQARTAATPTPTSTSTAAGPLSTGDPAEQAQSAARAEPQEPPRDLEAQQATTQSDNQPANQPTTQPVKRTMIVGHSNDRVAAMFAGLLGDLKEETFTLDRRYQDVCYLFTLAMQGAANLERGMQLAEIEFPNPQHADQFFFNMLGATARQWDRMYEGAAAIAGAGDLVGNMLGAERTMVKSGAERLIGAAGLSQFAVPVRAEAFVAEPYEGAHAFETEQQLMKAARINAVLMTLDLSDDRPVALVAAGQAEVVGETPLANEHRGHDGAMEMVIVGTVTVLATDAQSAAAIAGQLLNVCRQGVVQNLLTITPQRVENLTLMPREASTDDDGRDYPNTRIGY